MDGRRNQESHMQLTSPGTVETSSDVFHSSEEHPKFVAAASGRNGSQWTCIPKFSHNYVEFFSESSTYLPNTATDYMFGSSYLPLASFNNGNCVNGIDRSFIHNDPARACAFKPIDSSSNVLDFKKQVGFWRPDDGETENNQNALYAENLASWTTDSVGDMQNAHRFDPTVMVGAPSFLPKPGSSSSKQKTRFTDRQRRQRIADNLKALHEFLPNPAEGSQANILDDIIDYVKYLQLQIKEKGGTKLQAESTGMSLIFHEGYGHYIDQQMLNEPLEEIMGKLLDEHSAAASQFLESKGLFLLPMVLVKDLNEALQVFGGSAFN